MTPTFFREPRSLYSMNRLEAKNNEKLIQTELKEFLPALALKLSPLKYIQDEIAETILKAFDLNRRELNGKFQNKIVKYIIVNRIVEQPHWFYKDYINSLLLAGMCPILSLWLLLKQVYIWPGVNNLQQRRVLKVGLQHARSNKTRSNKTGGGTIWVGEKMYHI